MTGFYITMCLRPIKIHNNSKYVNLKDFDVMRTVPCGNCAECIRQKQTEYALRAYYEQLECEKNHGFIYFEMLSYAPEHLPTTFGYPHFNMRHVKLFIKSMRRQLEYHYNISKDAFRYLIVSEYGEEFHRPHYHVLFFVHSQNINVRDFHDLIHKCWKYGVTDLSNANDIYKGLVKKIGACTNYVTKYIFKENDFVYDMLLKINEVLHSYGYNDASIDSIRKRWQPFHLSSKGFGNYYLEKLKVDEDLQKYLEDLQIYFPTKKNPKKAVPLPLYYKRHLFYSLQKNPDGSQSWILNKDSANFMETYEYKHYNTAVNRNHDIINSLPSLYALCKEKDSKLLSVVDNFIEFYSPDVYSLDTAINSLLDGRSIDDYTVYSRYFKDRVIGLSCDAVDITHFRIFDVFKPVAIDYNVDSIISDSSYKRGKRSKKIPRVFVVVPDSSIDIDGCLVPNPLQPDLFPDAAESAEDSYIRIKANRAKYKGMSINQNSFPEFRDFDTLFNIIKSIRECYSVLVDASEAEKRAAERKLKNL